MALPSQEDFDVLKRQLESIELTIDTSNKEVVEVITILKDSIDYIKTKSNEIQANNVAKFNSLVDTTSQSVFDLQTQVTTLTGLDEQSTQDLINKINVLKGLILEDILELIPAIDKIADTVNELDRVHYLGIVSVDSANGTKTVDISSLGLADTNYAVTLTRVDTPPTANAGVYNQTIGSFEIKVYDDNYFTSDQKVWDATKANRGVVKYSVVLARYAKADEIISVNVTPLDNTQSVTIGSETGAGGSTSTPAGE